LPDAGRADLVYLTQLIEAVIKEAGATVVNLPDTTGIYYLTSFNASIICLKMYQISTKRPFRCTIIMI
jgi:isopropylmalate/homocitrate/citramalate synthase